MMYQQLLMQSLELGWDFYGPLLIFVGLIILGVPIWASIGVAAAALLIWSGALPLSLLGESLFDGIDHFALTAVPLFILTGDVLVRTGLSKKFLDVAEAFDLLDTWRIWFSYCPGMRNVQRNLGVRRGRCCSGRSNDYRATRRIRLSEAVCMRFSSQWCLYRYFDTTIYSLYRDRSSSWYIC